MTGDRSGQPMRVADLIAFLRDLSPDLQVVAEYDCRCARGGVVAAEVAVVADDLRESVILIIW
jgi:hypothetical protein